MSYHYDDLRSQRNLYVLTTWTLTLTACLSAGVVLTSRDRPVQAFGALAGSVATIPGFLSQQKARQVGLRLNDLQDINTTVWQTVETQQRLTQGYQGLSGSPSLPQVPAVDIPWFDWDSIDRDRRNFPHLAILAPTGTGKSTLAEWLAEKLTGRVIVSAPHYKPGDFLSGDIVLCKGRNYGDDARPYSVEETRGGKLKVIGEPTVFFKDILAGRANPTCAQFMRSLVDEMSRRYALREQGKEDWEDLNIILDEFNAYAKLRGVSDCFKQLVREARKVGIRLIVLVQGKEAKALGIEGETSLRQSIVFLRLGKEALEHARSIRSKSKGDLETAWEDIVNRLESLGFPAMADDVPASVPDLGSWQPTKGTSSEPSQSPDETEETSGDNFSPDQLVLYRQMLNFGRQQGFTDSDIIQNLMGFKGRRYKDGKALLEQLGRG